MITVLGLKDDKQETIDVSTAFPPTVNILR